MAEFQYHDAILLLEDIRRRHGQYDLKLLVCFVEYALEVQRGYDLLPRNAWQSVARIASVSLESCLPLLQQTQPDPAFNHDLTSILAMSYIAQTPEVLDCFRQNAHPLAYSPSLHLDRLPQERMLLEILYRNLFSFWLAHYYLELSDLTRSMARIASMSGSNRALALYPTGVRWMNYLRSNGMQTNRSSLVVGERVIIFEEGEPDSTGTRIVVAVVEA